jgi:required for meiotic nuclear division protein 1
MFLVERIVDRVGERLMTKPELISIRSGAPLTAHALNVGARINTIGFEGEALSTVPLAIRVGNTGVAVLFRYGIVVLIGVSPHDESCLLERLTPRIWGKIDPFEEETAIIVVEREGEDQVQVQGPIQLRDF